jgi:hypothetical protein
LNDPRIETVRVKAEHRIPLESFGKSVFCLLLLSQQEMVKTEIELRLNLFIYPQTLSLGSLQERDRYI